MDSIDANGASLRYDVSGSGNETVVLIHEVGGCSVSVAPPDRGAAARRPSTDELGQVRPRASADWRATR